MRIVAYKYHAALYCPAHGEDLPDVDPEGNDKHAIYSNDTEALDAPAFCAVRDCPDAALWFEELTEHGAAYVVEQAVIAAEDVLVRGEAQNDGYFRDVITNYGASLARQLTAAEYSLVSALAERAESQLAGAWRVYNMAEQAGGTLPAHAFPGGYPIYYLDAESNVLCADCADQNNDYTAPLVGASVHEEGGLDCDHCSKPIE